MLLDCRITLLVIFKFKCLKLFIFRNLPNFNRRPQNGKIVLFFMDGVSIQLIENNFLHIQDMTIRLRQLLLTNAF